MGKMDVGPCVESKIGEKTHGSSQNSESPFDFLFQIPQNFQNSLREHYNKFHQNKETSITATTFLANESPGTPNVNLEKQMKAWWDNPHWTDQPPEVKVTVPKGTLCNLNLTFRAGLPPDAIFDILIDPENKRVFKNVKEVISRKVLLDEGSRQVVEVEQAALWKFLWLTGILRVHLLVEQDRGSYTVKFKQGRTGFMERFEGSWKIEPFFVDEELCIARKPKTLDEYNACTGGRGRVGSALTLRQLVQPSIVPPPPISWYVRGITTRTTEMMVEDLLAETARLRSLGCNGQSKEGHNAVKDNSGANGSYDIKDRWRRRRGTPRSRMCFNTI